jgi:glucuronokinase
MVRSARQSGATAKFAGSGGAIVGTYKGEDGFKQLQAALEKIGVAVLKPRISEPAG